MSYFIWLMLGVVAFVVEMTLPTFFALFAGIGFIVAAAVAYFYPEAFFWQVIVASVFMIVGAVIFKMRRLGDDDVERVGTHNEFIGITGIAKTVLSPNREGEVELYKAIVGSRHWPAISEKSEIDEGSEVRVVKLNGNTLTVEKI
jgi:membrane protein implicated in regulation of membrane protease activity